MKKMNQRAREHDYYISGYAMNSYQQPSRAIDVIEVVKSVSLFIVLVVSVVLFFGSLFGVIWIEELGHDAFLVFSTKQLEVGGCIGLSLIGGFAGLSDFDMM